jgi:hypothetical protein
MGIISFGRGPAPLSSSNSDDFTSQGRSTSRTGATWGASDTERGALVRGEGAVGSAGFGAEIRNEFQRAQAAMKASEAQIRSTTSFLPGENGTLYHLFVVRLPTLKISSVLPIIGFGREPLLPDVMRHVLYTRQWLYQRKRADDIDRSEGRRRCKTG